jgi:uncharacterized membrane protein YcaP (DUF421 family)
MCHETMFHLCLPATEKILRTVIVYFFLIIGLRLAGKRELAQLNAFDFVVLITISNAVQNAIIGPENSLTGGLLGATTLLLTNSIVVRLTYWFPWLSHLLQGRETILYRNGETNMRAARREQITEGELLTAAKRQGARDLNEVEEIALEPNGNLIVTLNKEMTEDRILRELRELREELRARPQPASPGGSDG